MNRRTFVSSALATGAALLGGVATLKGQSSPAMTGGNARFITNAGGIVDFSRVTLGATTYEQVLTLGVAAAASVLYVGLYAGHDRDVRLWFLALLPLGLVFLHPRVFGPLTTWALAKVGRDPLPRLRAGCRRRLGLDHQGPRDRCGGG